MLENVIVNTQSSVRIETTDGIVVYFDPLHIVEDSHDASFVCITHDHFDHFSPEDIAKVAHADTALIVPSTMAGAVRDAFTYRVITMNPKDRIDLSDELYIEAVAAYNLSSSYHPKSKGWLGYVLDDKRRRYYVMGDTDATPESIEAASTCDTVFVPIGGTYTMDALEAAAFANEVRLSCVVPIHYGSYAGTPADGDTFVAALDPAITVVPKLQF